MKHDPIIKQMKTIFLLFTLTFVVSCNTGVKESQSLTDLKIKKASLIDKMELLGQS